MPTADLLLTMATDGVLPQPSRWNRFAALGRVIANPAAAAVLLLLCAIAMRMAQFGNPVVQIDDQFYLLVGDRMWHGALPYIDIWDRKPLGLFLIYALIRLLPGDGIFAYQIVATLFAAATAWVIMRAALRLTSARGAFAAAAAYLMFLGMFGGEAGQAPVFYNLFVALAGLLVIRAIERRDHGWRAIGGVALATALMGVAMQIKYTALFEGAYFGLAMMWRHWRGGVGPARLSGIAAMWLGLALFPTMLAWWFYWRIGHGADFYFANFTSIFARSADAHRQVYGRLLAIIAKLLPLATAAALARWPRTAPAPQGYLHEEEIHRFVVGWAIAAAIGVVLFGSYFDHYALPLLVPFAIAAAPLLGDPTAGVAVVARGRRYLLSAGSIILIYAFAISVATIDRNQRVRGKGSQVRAMAAFLVANRHGCPFVYDGEPILYLLSSACLPTRWPFPDHLTNSREDGAIGVDTLAETRRIMAARPALIVSSTEPESKTNWRTWNFMQQALARDYIPLRNWKIGNQHRVIYGLKRPARG